MSMRNFSDNIGNRTRNLTACSAAHFCVTLLYTPFTFAQKSLAQNNRDKRKEKKRKEKKRKEKAK
jgi:hypothetical protein